MQDRSEWYTARQMHQLCLINGGKAELSDFMSFYREEQSDEATPQDFFNVLQASATSNQ